MTVNMKEMLRAGVHFGHQCRYWNPKMEPYIFGSRNKIHIINLEHTVPALNDALEQITELADKRRRSFSYAPSALQPRLSESRQSVRECLMSITAGSVAC